MVLFGCLLDVVVFCFVFACTIYSESHITINSNLLNALLSKSCGHTTSLGSLLKIRPPILSLTFHTAPIGKQPQLHLRQRVRNCKLKKCMYVSPQMTVRSNAGFNVLISN